ncbi:MAG: hypothetical protein J0L62_06045 [Bacteroidetes bacterium]|nr:hypothetical protein [Bacteroidota bacterium]
MKSNYLFTLFSFVFIVSGCGTMKLSDNTHYLSKPVFERKYWTVKSQGRPSVVLNSLETSWIAGDSLKLDENNGRLTLPVSDILSLAQSGQTKSQKEIEELKDMKREGGLLIGGIIGAGAGSAIAGDDFGGKGVLLTLSGTAVGAGLGYWFGSKIVLNSETPTITLTNLSGMSTEKKIQILSGLVGKNK